MNKSDLALNNLQWLICHKTQTNQIFCQFLSWFKFVNQLSLLKMKSASRVQILEEAFCILLCTNTLKKGLNPSVLPPVMGK